MTRRTGLMVDVHSARLSARAQQLSPKRDEQSDEQHDRQDVELTEAGKFAVRPGNSPRIGGAVLREVRPGHSFSPAWLSHDG